MRVPTPVVSRRLRPLSVSLARLGSLLGIAAALGAGSAHGANLSWDPAADQSNSGGSGTWDLTSAFWNDGVAPNEIWPNLADSVAVFGGTGGFVSINTDAGALTGTGITANGLTFNVGGYTIESSDPAEVLTLAGAAPTIRVTNAADTATITATIAGVAGLTKEGAGTLALFGANTFLGGVSVNAGTLSIGANENLGAAGNGISLANGAVLNAIGTFTAARVLSLGSGGGTVDIAPGQNMTLSAAIATSNETLLKTGTGTLTLGASSTRTGATVVTAGTLALTNVAAAGTGDILVNGATLLSAHDAGGQNFAANVMLDAGTFIHNPGTGQQLNFAAGKAISILGGGGTIEVSPMSGAASKVFLGADQLRGAGALTKTGLGVLQLSGANLNFSGAVLVNQGTLEFQNVDSLGAGVRTITLAGGDFTSTGIAVRHNFVLETGGILSANGNPNADYQGTINVAGDASAALRFFQATGTGNSFRISGPLTGAGNLTATAPTAQTLTLTGNNSAFTGKVIAGTNATVLLPNLQSIAPGTLSLNGGTMRIQAQNTANVTVGQPGLNATYYNFGTNPGTGSAQFAGDVLYTQPRAFSRIDQQINMPNTGFGSFPIVPMPGYAMAAGTGGGTQDGIMWKGLLNVTSAGTYQFAGTNDDNLVLYIDGVQIGTLGVTAPQVNIGAGVNLSAGFHSIVVKHTQGAGGGYATVSYNGPDTGNATQLLGSVPNSLSTGGFAPIDLGPVTSNGGTLDLLNDAFTSSLSLGPGTFTVASQTLHTLVAGGGIITGFTPTIAVTTNGLTFAGAITEAFPGLGLNIAGPSFVEFQGANSYTGLTSVTGGQLRLNSATGDALSGNLSLSAANAAGEIANARLFRSNQIADSASIAMSNNAVLDLGANNETVSGLALNGGKITGTGTLTVTDLTNSQFTRGSIFANLAGNGDLNISAGSNTVLLGGQNTYTGPTLLSNGTLRVQSSNLGAGGAGNETFVAAGGQLLLAGASALGLENIVMESDTGLRVIGSTSSVGGTIQYLPTATAPVLRVDAGAELILDNLILSGAPVTKTGAGTLTFNRNIVTLPANVVLSAGALGFNGPQSFGAATVPSGLAYQFNSDPGAGVSLTAPSSSSIIAGYAANQALISRITAGSAGTLALGVSSANDLSFASVPNLSLGAIGMRNAFSGVLTPGANGYLLGGGGGELNVLSSLTGAAPLRVSGPGVVALNGQQAFQGEITVDGGRLRVLQNGNLGAEGNDITLTNGGVLDLTGTLHNAGLIGALFLQLGNPFYGNSRTVTIGAGGGTINLSSFNNVGNAWALTGVNSLTGSGNLTKTGFGDLFLFNASNFSGGLIVDAQGGRVEVRSSGKLAAVSSIEIRQSAEVLIDNHNSIGSRQFPTVNDNDRLNDAAGITLRGGQFTYRGKGTAGQTSETIGTTTLAEGHSRIALERNGQGADLTIANLVRNTGGGTVYLQNNGGTFGNTGNEPRMFLTQINGVASATTPLIGGWAMLNNNGTLDWAAYNATQGVRTATYVNQGIGAFTPAANQILNFNAAGDHALTDAGGAGHNVLALRYGFNGAQTISFANPSDTLFIGSGGILDQNFNQARTIGTAASRGIITAGSSTAAAGPKDLFLHINQGTTTIESVIADNNGPVKLIKDLDGIITINNPGNTYSGGTSLYRGRINVQNTGGLGTGPVLVKAAALELRAAGATSDTSGILAIDNSEVYLPTGVPYTQDGDRFIITAGSTITGHTNVGGVSIGSLTRVQALTGPGQVVLLPGAIVRSTNPFNGDVMTNMLGNLGTDADLYFNMSGGGGQQQFIHVGAGTPWKGLSSSVGTGWTQGTIFANSDFYLQGLTRVGGNVALTLGAASNVGGYSIVNLAGRPVNAFVEGQVTLAEDTPISLPTDLTFVVRAGGYLQPNISNSFGSFGNVANVLVQAGGTMDPGPFVGVGAQVNQPFGMPYPIPSPMNANVVFEAGSRLLLNDVSGVGSTTDGRTWTMKDNSVLQLVTPVAFLGSNAGLINNDQFVWEPGAVVRFETGRVYKHDQFINNAAGGQRTVLELINGNRDVTDAVNPFVPQAVGTNVVVPMTLTFGDGGMITNDSVDRQINERRGKIVLNDGAVLAGTVGTYLNVNEGFHASAGATIHIGANKYVDGLLKLGGVTFNGAATHTAGAGVTFRVADGAQLAFNTVHVFPDTAALHLPAAVDFSLRDGAVAPQLGNGSTLLLNTGNYIEVVGPLTGNGSVFTQQDNAALGVGWGATSDFTFDGQFRATTFTTRAPSLVKVGPTKMTLTATHDTPTATGVINSPGAILVYQGEVSLAGPNGKWTGGELRIAKGGTLTFDNSQFAVADRQTGTGTGNRWITTLGGGDFRLLGHPTDVANVPLFGLANGSGSGGFGLPGGNTGGFGKVTVLPAGDLSTLRTSITFGQVESFTGAERKSVWLIRGPGVAGLPGSHDVAGVYVPNAGNPNDGLVFVTSPNLLNQNAYNQNTGGSLVFNAPGTSIAPVRGDLLASVNPTATEGDFATIDVASGALRTGVRVLQASEYASTAVNNANLPINVRMTGAQSYTGDTRVQVVKLENGASLSVSGNVPNLTQPSQFILNAGGILVPAGATASISATGNSVVRSNGNIPAYLHAFGNLNVTGEFFSDVGLVKTGVGTATFAAGSLDNLRARITVHEGTLSINDSVANIRNTGNNTTGFDGTRLALNGGTLNINGKDQFFLTFESGNMLPGAETEGGTLTSATAARVTIQGGGTFSGHIGGAISLHKAGNNTLLLTNTNSLSGNATIRQGTVLLRDQGTLTNVATIDLNYARLDIDNGYLSGMSNRLNNNVTLNMRSGDFVNRGRAGELTKENLGTVNLLQGHNLFQTLAGGSGATETVIGTLNKSLGSTATFQQNFGFTGAAGDDTTAIRYIIGNVSVNGAAAAPLTLTNGIIGGWAIANNDHFATYDAIRGIGALSNTEEGFATYGSVDVTAATATPTANVNDGANRTIAASKTVNAIRNAPNAANTWTISAGQTLTVASGGILTNNNNVFTYAGPGTLTSGIDELYFTVSQNRTDINAPIVGAGVSLVKGGSGTLRLGANNTYGGATYFNNGQTGSSSPSGLVELNLTGANGTTSVSVPSTAVHINSTTVTELLPNQFNQAATVNLYGGAILFLRDAGATEQLAGLTFSHAGGDANNRAVVSRNALQTGGVLNLTGATPIIASNDNPTSHPTLRGNIGTVNFTGAPGAAQTLMIDSPVSLFGLAAAGMVWETPIGSVASGVVDGGLVKAGNGLFILNPAWQIGGGATTTGSNTITVASTTGLTVGMPVFGANIPAGSTITSIVNATSYTISANATAAATGQTFSHVPVNIFGNLAAPTDVFNIQSGIVRIDNHGALGSANAITTVQDDATLLLNFNGGILGSVRLKDGASLGVSINSSILGPVGSTGTLTVPAGANANILLRDYYVPNTNNGNIVVNHKFTGAGTVNLSGIEYSAGYNGGGLFQLRNPSNDFTGLVRIGTNAILEASTSDVSGTGSTITGASLELSGGSFRIRDNGDGSTAAQTLAYGNSLTLSANSFLDFDRQSGGATNKTIAMGALTVAAGRHVLNTTYGTGAPIAGNGYRAAFTELSGPGTLVKGGTRIVEINSYAPGFSGGIEIAGPQGITLPASGNLILPGATGTFTKFSVSGFHAFTNNAVDASVLEITNNPGVVPNGLGGITTGEVTGSLSVSSGSTVSATVLRNNGMVSSNGTAIIAAQAISGNGLYNAFGQDLILEGVLADEGATTTRLKTVASSSAAVTLTASASGNTGGAEVQNGTLRIAPTGPASNPLGTGGIRVHGAPAMAAATNSQAVAAVNAILEFAGSAISQAGDIQNNGTIRVSGGVTTLTGAVIGGPDTLTPANFLANTVPGLLEGSVGSSDFSTNRTPNPGNFGVKMEPRMAQTNVVTQDIRLGWTDNTAWVYTGYFYDADGVFTFAENIDDNSFISIDGETRLMNNSGTNPWQTVTSTATTVGQRGTLIDTAITNTGTPQGLTAIPANPSLPDGWHSIEIRLHNGGGGGGAVVGNGFHNNYGLGLNPNGTMTLDGTQFLRPIDPGDGTLFRTAAFGKGSIEVAATSTLNVARLDSAGTLRFTGADGRINLTGTGTASTSDRIEALNLSYLNVTANSSLTVGEVGLGTNILVVNSSGDLVNGVAPTGQLNVVGAGTGSGTLDFGGGILNVTGSISGSVTMGDGILSGNSTSPTTGLIAGVADLLGGEVSPNLNQPGMLRFEGGLGFNGAGYSVNINGLTPGTGYDQLNVVGGVSLTADVALTLSVGFQPAIGDKFAIVLNDGAADPVVTSAFFTSGANLLLEGESIFVSPFHEFTISYQGGDGNDIELTYAVPEPGAITLLLGGLATMCARRRRKR